MLNVSKIRAKAFRGIGPELSVRLGENSLVLLGDNGTGKSSIIEALEHAFTGGVRSLSTKGQRVSVAKHATHVQHKPTDRVAAVILSDSNENHEVLFDSDRKQYPASVQRYLTGAADGSFILRRSSLLSFVEVGDKDRYEALRPFLFLEDYDDFEELLKDVHQKAERKAAMSKEQKNSVALRLKACLNNYTGDFSESSIVQSINALLTAQDFNAIKTSNDLGARIVDISARIESFGNTDVLLAKAQAASLGVELASVLPNITDIQQLIDSFQRKKSEEEKSQKTFDEKLLEIGQRWILQGKLQDCPLCEQSIDYQVVLKSIERRLNENQALMKARTEASQCTLRLGTRTIDALRISARAQSAWAAAGISADCWPYAVAHATCTDLAALLQTENTAFDFSKLERVKRSLSEFDIKTSQADVLKILGDNSFAESTKSLVHLQTTLVSLKQHLAEFALYCVTNDRESEIASQSKQLHLAAVTARKKASEEVFRTIESHIGEIYNAFHPDEQLGNFTFEVKDAGHGSVVIKSDFADRIGEDPRAFYSEAHQDTLGLAIFLALRKRSQTLIPEFNLTVLDDILMSVDAPHRERVANYLLSQAAQGQQLIITTHSRQWYEWLLQIQAAHGSRQKFVNKQIMSWSLESGPLLQDPEDDFDLLLREIDNRDGHQLVPIAGRLLESILQQLRFSLQLAVQARPDDRYTLFDIYPVFASTCKKKFKHLWKLIDEPGERLNNTWGMRNWDSHANAWAKDLSQAEAKQFINPVMELYSKVFCQSCRTFVQLGSTPQGIISCRKGCITYLPAAAALSTSAPDMNEEATAG